MPPNFECGSRAFPTRGRARLRRAAIPLVVAALTAGCFLPVVSGAFLNWDDDVNFRLNPAFRRGGWEPVRWALGSVLFGHYIPLTRLTFVLNDLLGGTDPRGYHLANVLLHGLNAALFYVVARRLLTAAGGATHTGFERTAAAATAALVFGVHPLRVEPVAWVTGRADLLCATFVLVATWAYLRAVQDLEAPRRPLLLACAAAFAAALLSKGSALPLPAALLLLDVYPLRRLGRVGWRGLVREKVPLVLIATAATAIIAYATRHGAVVTGTDTFGPGARLTVAAYCFVTSAARFVWPAALSPLYEMPLGVTPLEPAFGLAVGAAVVVTVVLIALRRRWPGGLAAWTFSALMLAPMSAALRKTTDLAPDRYTYLAGLGFALLAGGALLVVARWVRSGVLGRSVAWAGGFACAAAIVGLGVSSWTYAETWRDPETLWRWAVEMDPACSVCQSKLGESVLGDPAEPLRAVEAEALFRRAIALRPDRPHAYFNLGTALLVQGRYAEAESPLQGYIERVPKSALGPERLGRAYLLQQRFDAAITALRTALARQPDMPGLRAHLIEALEGRARELSAEGRAGDAGPLLAESRALAR